MDEQWTGYGGSDCSAITTREKNFSSFIVKVKFSHFHNHTLAHTTRWLRCRAVATRDFSSSAVPRLQFRQQRCSCILFKSFLSFHTKFRTSHTSALDTLISSFIPTPRVSLSQHQLLSIAALINLSLSDVLFKLLLVFIPRFHPSLNFPWFQPSRKGSHLKKNLHIFLRGALKLYNNSTRQYTILQNQKLFLKEKRISQHNWSDEASALHRISTI